MQSEIDDIRMALTALGILSDAHKLTCDEIADFIGFVSKRLNLIEQQQAVNLPVMTLAQIAHMAAASKPPHLRLVEGDRP